jgi:hypothetical protein
MELSLQLLFFAVQFVSDNQTLDNCVYGLKMTLNMSDHCPWVQNRTPEISCTFHVHLLLFVVQLFCTKITIDHSSFYVKITVNMSDHRLYGRNVTGVTKVFIFKTL